MSEEGRSPSVEPGYSSEDDVLKQIGKVLRPPRLSLRLSV